MLINILLIAVLGLCAGLAVGTLWKNRKNHGCGGNCAHCSGCPHGKTIK